MKQTHSNKSFSIIIITLNEAERIQNILNDIANQSTQNFEVIVVDSNSNDNTCKLAESFANKISELTVHNMHSRGVSKGRNTGAKLAKYERLLFLDADVRLDKYFLQKASGLLDKKQLKVAGVYMSARNLPLNYRAGYAVFNAGLFATQFGFPTAVGACIFSSKEVHEYIGGFDENISLCEDCDYVNRASKKFRFRFLPVSFSFDPRRLEQDGFVTTGFTYIKANVHRFFKGEMRNNEIEYKFGHYHSQVQPKARVQTGSKS